MLIPSVHIGVHNELNAPTDLYQIKAKKGQIFDMIFNLFFLLGGADGKKFFIIVAFEKATPPIVSKMPSDWPCCIVSIRIEATKNSKVSFGNSLLHPISLKIEDWHRGQDRKRKVNAVKKMSYRKVLSGSLMRNMTWRPI